MTDADPLSGLQFSDVPPLPEDAPNFTASQDGPADAPLTDELPRRRRLPGSGGLGSGKRTQQKAEKPPKEPRPNIPMPPGPRGFAPAIEKAYRNLSLAVTPWDVDLGAALDQVAPEAADAWNELAKRNQAVRRFIVAITETTAWGAVVAAHSPIIGLMFARMMGDKPRVSMVGLLMGQQEAERYANNGHPDTENGNPQP